MPLGSHPFSTTIESGCQIAKEVNQREVVTVTLASDGIYNEYRVLATLLGYCKGKSGM